MRRNLQKQFKVRFVLLIIKSTYPSALRLFHCGLSSQGSVFICFDTEESSKGFLERSDIKTFKDNEMLVLSRYVLLDRGTKLYPKEASRLLSITFCNTVMKLLLCLQRRLPCQKSRGAKAIQSGDKSKGETVSTQVNNGVYFIKM